MVIQFDLAEIRRTDVKNASLVGSVQGAVLGLILGLLGGVSRRAYGRGVLAGASGLLVGGLVGGGAAFGAFTVYFLAVGLAQGDILPSLLAHEAAWVPLGATAGLAFGLGGGRPWRGIVGGLLGAAGGGMLYEILGSLLFPLGKTGDPVAASAAARAFAHAAVDIGCSLGCALSVATATPPLRFQEFGGADRPSSSEPSGL